MGAISGPPRPGGCPPDRLWRAAEALTLPPSSILRYRRFGLVPPPRPARRRAQAALPPAGSARDRRQARPRRRPAPARIVIADLGREAGDFRRADIGRIRRRSGRTVRTAPPHSRRRRSRRDRRARDRRRCCVLFVTHRQLMSVPTPKASGNSDNSASRIAPEPVPMSAMRKRTIRTRRGAQHFQRQLDHGFGVGPRHQRRGRELQRQSPEFPGARECARPARRRAGGARNPQAASLRPM